MQMNIKFRYFHTFQQYQIDEKKNGIEHTIHEKHVKVFICHLHDLQ